MDGRSGRMTLAGVHELLTTSSRLYLANVPLRHVFVTNRQNTVASYLIRYHYRLLADRNNGRAYATVLCLSVCLSVVCRSSSVTYALLLNGES